jgi:hypothetical protein
VDTNSRPLVRFRRIGGGASSACPVQSPWRCGVSYEIAERLSKIVIPAQAGIQSDDDGGFSIDVVTMGYKGFPKYEGVNKNFDSTLTAAL